MVNLDEVKLYAVVTHKWWLKWLVIPVIDTLYLIEYHLDIEFLDDDSVESLIASGMRVTITDTPPDVEFKA